MEFFKPDYDLKEFSEKNKKRCDEVFKLPNVQLYYLALAINEEAGEVAGALKKMERGFTPRDYKKLRVAILQLTPEGIHNLYPTLTEHDLKQLWVYETLEELQELYPYTTSRLANIHRQSKQDAFASELADVFIYLDLAATSAGLNLWEEVKKKFNKVSQEMDTDIKI